MKKIILTALLVPAMALAQTFPSPTFNSLTLQNPLTAANGGTGATTSTGSGSAVLSNSPTLATPALGTPSAVTLTNGTGLPISTGVSGLGTGVAAGLANAVTGSGSPVLATSPTIASPTVTGAFTATGLVTLADHATQAANTIIGNGTASTASPTALAMPSCSTSGSGLQWASGTGFACNSAINAATLGGATFAAPGNIGTGTPGNAVFNNIAIGNTTTFPFELTSSGGQPTVGGIGSIATTATLGKIFDGSLSSPHTALTPSVAITRTEAMNSNTLVGNSPALWVETVSNNTGTGNPNGNAVLATSTQNGTGDTVAVVGWAFQNGTAGHYAYGGFFNGQSSVAGDNAYAVETYTSNNTGTNYALNTASVPPMVGLHVTAGGSNNALDTSALWISNDTGNPGSPAIWDSGLYFSAGSVASESIIDVSNSSSSILIGGSHQYGLNLISGTYSGNAIQATGFNVNNTGVMSSTGVTNGGAASAGFVGEVQAGNSTASLTSSTAANCASKTLTSGDWLVWGSITFSPAASTTISAIYGGLNTTSATLPAGTSLSALAASFLTGNGQTFPVPMTIENVSSSTTVYLVGESVFGTSTMTCGGAINAIRFR